MLPVETVAKHFGLKPDTVRRKIRSGEISAVRLGRHYRLAWTDVWACEVGPMPKRAHFSRYQTDLLAKKDIAAALSVSVRTVENWIESGMPTRNVFGSVRCNPHDTADWLRLRGVELPANWWA